MVEYKNTHISEYGPMTANWSDGEEFACVVCGGIFDKGRTDTEAQEEFKRSEGRYPDPNKGDEMVCEGCYHKILVYNQPDEDDTIH